MTIIQCHQKKIEALGRKAKAYASDASNFEQINEAVTQIVNDFNTVDILVNNAGITMDTLLKNMDEKQWDTVINVNLKSLFNFIKSVQKIMIKACRGRIVILSSIVGIHGNIGQVNYSASKAGIIGFTKSIAQELGSRNIRCNAVAPGFIITEMTNKLTDEQREAWVQYIPLKRGGTPEEVANVMYVCF